MLFLNTQPPNPDKPVLKEENARKGAKAQRILRIFFFATSRLCVRFLHIEPRFHCSSALLKLALSCTFIFTISNSAHTQTVESTLEKLMVKYEEKVLTTYQEMQALDKSEIAKVERVAFDSVLSAYSTRVLEIYETLNRIKGFTLENYRNIAGRALIFRALAFLEIANEVPQRLVQACSDYRRALILTKDSKIPVINQQLPYEVWVEDRLYTRLADLLDDKDKSFILLKCMQQTTKKE
ncbi:MAG: hypothetical protein ACE5I1_04690 [bacterium]